MNGDVGLGVAIDPRRIEVIDDRTAEILRKMTPWMRVRRGLEMAEFARAVIATNVRHKHPDWSEARVQSETVRRFSRG